MRHPNSKPRWRCALVALPLYLAFATSSGAEQKRLTLDVGTTDISFELLATGHDVHGVLVLDHGEITFDPGTGEASGEIAIDARLAGTGGAKRDRAMHQKVLKSEDHPMITFRPDRIEGEVRAEGDSTFAVRGTMTLLGESHDFSLPIAVSIEDGRAVARSTFKVPYVKWGLHNPSMLVLRVAKEVEVTVHTAGSLE